MTWPARILTGVLAVAVCFASSQPALGGPRDGHVPKRVRPLSESLEGEAKKAYEAGKIAYDASDYAGALLKFGRAEELSNDPRLLWNMAVAAKDAHDYVAVADLLHRYLDEGGDYVTAEDRKKAEEVIAAVAEYVEELDITTTPEGATVTIDGKRVGVTPLSHPVRVNMGTHQVRASRTDYADVERDVDAKGNGKLSLSIDLPKEPSTGHVTVMADRDDAISLDGTMVGRGRWNDTVPAGPHVVHVSGDGRVPRDISFELQKGETRTLSVTLEKSSPIPAWPFVAGGTAIGVAGLAVGGYFLFKPAGPTRGTIGKGSFQLSFRGSF